MRILLVCRYCGFKEERPFYSMQQAKMATCKKCNDKNLTLKNVDENKVDQYKDWPKPLLDDEYGDDFY